ncbi:putative C6 finger domain protein [Aspergillus novofumigatus IBT 16806]|uniref:Uncharacterized protein n=1 Tax=Aspergillus novofumigatus (strain IBT 16806) TaxID=1392255 RepID=A0A2I1CEV4_ASPN1|nr:uncharacterized protein P174DRAFT_420027 [Aspergillus novofumigatus IBT 16806]PKX96156.1 hypothetical protein P174DRAFT_420027 [Aspergillus novofumigatus IBT 16806]
MESGTEQYGAYASQRRNGNNNANSAVPVAADQPRTGVCHATGRLSLASPPTDTLNDLSGTAGDGLVPESEPIQPTNASGPQTQNDESGSGIPRDACQSSESPPAELQATTVSMSYPGQPAGMGYPGWHDMNGSIRNSRGTYGSSRAGPAADFMS